MRPKIKRTIKRAILSGAVATLIGLGIKASSGIKIQRPFDELKRQGIPVAKSVNANYSGYCAAYAKDIAAQVSKKSYPLGNAWELPKRTRVTAEMDFRKKRKGFEQNEIHEMITTNTITKGTIV